MSLYSSLSRSLRDERRVVQVTVIDGPEEILGAKLLVWSDGSSEGNVPESELKRDALRHAASESAETGTLQIEVEGSPVELFLEVFAPPATLFIVGAVHIAIELVHFAKRLGFRTVVIDPRTVFATKERFSHADELVVRWPSDELAGRRLHDNTYCVFLTHDPKLDNPAIQVALEHRVRYVGALGSRRTHERRLAALRGHGLDDTLLHHIHAPIGVPLGGRRPEEIALSIAAELVQARHGIARCQAPRSSQGAAEAAPPTD